MKITHLEVERFGIWNSLSLPVQPGRLSVLSGPNEAGKTTLMRFLRGVLYGFPRPRTAEEAAAPSGLVEIEHNGRSYLVQRQGEKLTISGDRDREGTAAEALLQEMLHGVPGSTFDSVYCFGLEELQELAVLSGEEIVERLFGVSLGSQGRFVLESLRDADRRKRSLQLGTDNKVSMRRLLEEHDRLTRELSSEANPRDAVRALRRQLGELQERIENLQQRRDGIQDERRGHLFLQRVHGPWMQVRELEERLSDIPAVDSFPERGIERLDELEGELRQALRARESHRSAWKALREQMGESAIPKTFRRQAGAIELLVRQHDAGRRTLDEAEALTRHYDRLEEQFDHDLRTSVPGWTPERLRGLPVDGDTEQKLDQAAGVYRKTLRRRSKARRIVEKLSRRIQRQQQELEQQSRQWQGQSAQQMLDRTRREIGQLQERNRHGQNKALLLQRLDDLQEQRAALTDQEALPKGVRYLLSGFAICGGILALLGFWQGVTASWLAGAVYLLLGITCGGLGIALKWHFSGEHQDRLLELDRSRQELERQIRDINALSSGVGGDGSGEDLSSQLLPLAETLRRYQTWSEKEQHLKRDRTRASQLRAKFQEFQRDVSAARDRWCQALRAAGLEETVNITQGRAAWRSLSVLRQRLAELDAASERLDALRRLPEEIEASVIEVESQLLGETPSNDWLAIVGRWRGDLQTLAEERRRRKELAGRAREHRVELERLRRTINELRSQRSSLLTSGGASDRKVFDQRAQWHLERRELLELLQEARRELQTAAAAEPELAIVEEDLVDYDEEQNRDHIDVLTGEFEALGLELEDAYEQRGHLRHEIEALESNRKHSLLRQQIAELEEQIKDACERLLGVEKAARGMDRIRQRLERDHRPETLQRAERYFRQLTGGRYHRLWAPLGEHDLHVEDHAGLARALNELSGGTREQLLLSLRLALVDEHREKGVELPFILDDILVNFDQKRMHTAADTLIEYARSGVQVLMLTCHQHLADAFAERGAAVTPLPERNLYPERLAG